MRGVHPVKAAIEAVLVARIGEYCQLVATSEQVALDQVGPPRIIAIDQLLPPKQWPALYVTDVAPGRLRRVDTVNGDPVYERTYRNRIVGWAQSIKHGDAPDASLRRDRLERAVLELLLDNQTFGHDDLMLVEDSLTGEYSDPFLVEGRIGAGVNIDFDVVQVETITRPVLADPELDVVVEAHLIGE